MFILLILSGMSAVVLEMPVVLRICHDVEYIWHDQLFTDIFYDIFYEFVRLCYGHFSQSCVPFSLFLQRGLFDQPTAKAFRSNILEKRTQLKA